MSNSSNEPPRWRRYFRFYRADPVADFNDELQDHIDSTVAALVKEGMNVEAAREEALRRFGNVNQVRDEVQRMDTRHLRRNRVAEAMETFAQDSKFATRVLRRSPGFTFVAVLSVALAVAANTSVFSVVNALLLRSIPGVSAPRLMRVYINHHSPFSYHDLSWFRERQQSFDGFVGERSGAMSLSGQAGNSERVRTSVVTQDFFTTLGVQMALGNGFEGDENAASASAPVAVLTHQFWESHFASDSNIVGRTITLSGHPVTIVGVTAAAYQSSVIGWSPQIILPLAAMPTLAGEKLEDTGGSLYTTARLKETTNASRAGAELSVLMTQLAQTDTARYSRMTVRLDHTRGVNAELRPFVLAAGSFLMLMVGLVLLIACANVANLLLGRAAARHAEIGVRLALGAGRYRIVRQLLTESFFLAVSGSALGLVATAFLMRVAAAAIPAEAGMTASFFQPDGRVLVFTILMCLFTTFLFGLLPALRAASPNIVPLVRNVSQQHVRRGRGKLVAVQAALCVLLLAVASLFGRSLRSISTLDSGFRADSVLNAPLDLGLTSKDERVRLAQFARVLQRVNELPGVQAATLASLVPLAGSNMETRIAPEGMTAATRFDYPSTYFNVVADGYFKTLSIPIQAGRPILDTDAATAPRVAVVNETAAHRWWPNESAVGKQFHWGGAEGPLVQVVGIAKDADYNMPGEARKAFVYMPFAQETRSDMILQLKTGSSLATVREAIWKILREEVPSLPPPSVVRMHDDMALTLLPVKAGGMLIAVLGGVALLLASAGIYGVTTYAVARRTKEIGIRAALGANRSKLLQTITGETLRPVMIGGVVGIGLASLAAFGLGRVLYGVHTFDPVLLSTVVLLLGAAAFAASIVPAWRAATIDAMRAIRSE